MRADDGRGTGAHNRIPHTGPHDTDMVGDKRRLAKTNKAPKGSTGGRSVPIAETLGGDLKRRSNGAGQRLAPPSMLKNGDMK